jgi:hypothetical protein
MNFLTHEFSGLCGRRFALALVAPGAPQGFFLRH